MKRIGAALAGAVLAAVAGAAGADEPLNRNPSWDKLPDPADLQDHYPWKARQAGVEGTATIDCIATVEGTLKDCSIVSEDPEGYGFGEATIAASGLFRMNPRILNGKPAEGTVRVPLNWRLAEATPPDMSLIDTATAVRCFAVHVAALNPPIADDPEPTAFNAAAWAPLALAKLHDEAQGDRKIVDRRLRREIEEAAARLASDPGARAREVEVCEAAIMKLMEGSAAAADEAAATGPRTAPSTGTAPQSSE